MSFDLDVKMVFANKLRLEREKLGLLQKDMAKKLDIPPNTYNGYETGKRSPNLEVIDHIADTLNVSTDYLLGRTSEKTPAILDSNLKTIAAHKINIDDDLSDEAINKINEYIEMVKMMEKNKK